MVVLPHPGILGVRTEGVKGYKKPCNISVAACAHRSKPAKGIHYSISHELKPFNAGSKDVRGQRQTALSAPRWNSDGMALQN